MKVRELIEVLKKFPQDIEVTITDGYDCNCYHTKNIKFALFGSEPSLDIGIGGCKE